MFIHPIFGLTFETLNNIPEIFRNEKCLSFSRIFIKFLDLCSILGHPKFQINSCRIFINYLLNSMFSLLIPQWFLFFIFPHFLEIIYFITSLLPNDTNLHSNSSNYRIFNYLTVESMLLNFFIGSSRRHFGTKHTSSIHPSPESL